MGTLMIYIYIYLIFFRPNTFKESKVIRGSKTVFCLLTSLTFLVGGLIWNKMRPKFAKKSTPHPERSPETEPRNGLNVLEGEAQR